MDNYKLWEDRWQEFKVEELLSPDGLEWFKRGHLLMNIAFMDMLCGFRRELGVEFIINHGDSRRRGYRSPTESVKLGGCPYHPMGVASDVTPKGMELSVFAKEAEKYGFIGIGIYATFVHIDKRPSFGRSSIIWKGIAK